MKKVKIKVPIWSTQSIGIAERKITEEDIAVEILYKNKAGDRVYPHTYLVNAREAHNKPRDYRKGVTLILFKIDELRIKD